LIRSLKEIDIGSWHRVQARLETNFKIVGLAKKWCWAIWALKKHFVIDVANP
jgi:hypothetical protein